MTVTVNDSATSYVEELVQKKVKDYGEKKYDITDLFHMSYRDFANALTLYNLDCLEEFNECCQACLAVLVDQGAGAAGAETYNVYADYYNKLHEDDGSGIRYYLGMDSKKYYQATDAAHIKGSRAGFRSNKEIA